MVLWASRLRVAVAVLFALVMSARPACAQRADPAASQWTLQGGPTAGVSFLGGRQFEAGLRLGTRRGSGVVDLSISTYQIEASRPLLPPVRHRFFEALAGVTWQPGMLGVGFRSGVAIAPDDQGGHFSILVFGPHHALAVPIGQRFEFRSEAGLHLYYRRDWGMIGGPRGVVRVGLERRLR
jgi:hypothetical protein